MPQPRFRARTLRRVMTKLPSGKNVIHYEDRKPSAPSCSKCKVTLKGIKRMSAASMKSAGASNKRVERAYGGNLCSACAREEIKKQARV